MNNTPQATSNLTIFCDGGARGNPGPAACAFIVYHAQKIVYQQGIFLGVATNNQAEYQAVLHALQWLSTMNHELRAISFFLDSELVVKQLTGLYKIKDPILQQLANQIKQLLSTKHYALSTVHFSHIPRAKNSAADLLVNQTLDQSKS